MILGQIATTAGVSWGLLKAGRTTLLLTIDHHWLATAGRHCGSHHVLVHSGQWLEDSHANGHAPSVRILCGVARQSEGPIIWMVPLLCKHSKEAFQR